MPTVVSTINYGLNMAEGIIEGLVWGLNKQLASTDNIVVSLSDSLPKLNITAPRAPDMNETSDLISVWIDGRFVNRTTGQSFVPVNDVEPVRTVDHGQMEQFFIHESMVDSLVEALYNQHFYIKASESIREQLLQIFFEIGQFYGSGVQFEIDVSFNKTEGEVVQFDTQDGIEIGNMPAGGLNTNVHIYCTNETYPDPTLTLSLNLDVKANIVA